MIQSEYNELGNQRIIKVPFVYFSIRCTHQFAVLNAVPYNVYKESFIIPFIQTALKTNRVKYLVFDIKKEVIVKWKK